jgi:DNA-binding GntR family transcriptional regulator
VDRKRPSSLRSRVAQSLVRVIVDGGVDSGRVNESQLARKLGVSRTPLREALLSLERSGLVQESERGFILPPISRRSIRELYPIIADMEALAVRTGRASKQELDALRKTNRSFAAMEQPGTALRVDMKFHDVLTATCRNRLLLQMIHDLKLQIARVERLYLGTPAHVQRSAKQHREIIEVLSGGDSVRAASLVQLHWIAGMERLLEDLDNV